MEVKNDIYLLTEKQAKNEIFLKETIKNKACKQQQNS